MTFVIDCEIFEPIERLKTIRFFEGSPGKQNAVLSDIYVSLSYEKGIKFFPEENLRAGFLVIFNGYVKFSRFPGGKVINRPHMEMVQ
jgi:hypothetical protein